MAITFTALGHGGVRSSIRFAWRTRGLDEPGRLAFAPPLSLGLRDSAATSDGPARLAPSARAVRALLSSVQRLARSFCLSVSGAVSPSAPGRRPDLSRERPPRDKPRFPASRRGARDAPAIAEAPEATAEHDAFFGAGPALRVGVGSGRAPPPGSPGRPPKGRPRVRRRARGPGLMPREGSSKAKAVFVRGAISDLFEIAAPKVLAAVATLFTRRALT